MFTGIIMAIGSVAGMVRREGMTELSIDAARLDAAVGIGDSISVNGVCLTVARMEGRILFFGVSSETLKSTNIGALRTGGRVNLEPAMAANGRFGGHMVSGHVDGTGTITGIRDTGEGIVYTISAGDGIMRHIVKKGSITVDGISLTVVDLQRDGFTIVIIPHTAKETTLGLKRTGDTVNIETDLIAKYIKKFISARTENDSRLMNKLMEQGFIR